VPGDRGKTDYALIELEVAGIVMQPGQQPPTRNTRLAIVARNALKWILGDESVRVLTEPLQIGMDNGARRALIPLENKRHFLEVAGDIVERVDPIFFSDPMTAAMKALGMT
jgi:predicted ATP-dependent Lon-type protease